MGSEGGAARANATPPVAHPRVKARSHDRNLYTTTNEGLQCLIKITYTVF